MKLTSDISKFHYDSSSENNTLILSAKDDLTLWQDFKAGSKESFAVIYHRFFNDLYNYGLKISGDQNISKDCLQELFANLWNSREKLGDVKSIKFYLLKSFRRSIVHFLKKNKREGIFKIAFKRTQPDILFSPEEFIMAEESLKIKKEQIAKILNGLPKRRKEAIYLKYYKELSYEEIAAVMNLTEKAVINHVYKAFKSIRKSSQITSDLQFLLG
jgi:RNA polymerase sigma factor (sigma-70 family)